MRMLIFAESLLIRFENRRLNAALPSITAIIRPSLEVWRPVMISIMYLPATLATSPIVVLSMPRTV